MLSGEVTLCVLYIEVIWGSIFLKATNSGLTLGYLPSNALYR
jgi:hypothetical protein